jgi:hypothetical protein
MDKPNKIIFVSILSVILILCQQSYAIDDSNLVAHLTFDEGMGNTAHDSAGSNDGTIHGAQWVDGKLGSALYFDGINDYVEVPDDISLRPQYITMSAWVKPQQIPKYTNILIKSVYLDSSKEQYALSISPDVKPSPLIKRNSACKPGINWYGCFGETVMEYDQWYLETATWDGSLVKIYVNGLLEGISSSVPPGPIDNCVGGTLRIGLHWSQDPAWYKGIIDDVRIYDRALTDEEVLQLYLESITVPVAVDIRPASCPNPLNLKSRGLIPVAILGSQDLDVNSIDIASTRLAGTAPVRSNFEDVATPATDVNDCNCTTAGPDGYRDLVLKFKTQDIAKQLIKDVGEIEKNAAIELTLTGFLTTGRPIKGTDCIRIVGNIPRELKATKSDINEDGIVDFIDISLLAEFWLETAAVE